MFAYLETLGSTMENIIIIVVLLLLVIIVIGSGFFTYKIIKKIKEIKLKAAGAEVDIQIQSPSDTSEIESTEGEEK